MTTKWSKNEREENYVIPEDLFTKENITQGFERIIPANLTDAIPGAKEVKSSLDTLLTPPTSFEEFKAKNKK